MSEEDLKKYVLEALRKNFPVDDILKNLLSKGHDERFARSLVKKLVKQRISELEKEKLSKLKDPMDKTYFPKKLTMELLSAVFIRALVGMAMIFILAEVIIEKVYFL